MQAQEQRLIPIPAACGLAAALATVLFALLLAFAAPRPADARASMGSNCAGCHGTSSPTSAPGGGAKSTPKKKSAAAPAEEAAAPVPQTSSAARVQDYIPWTMDDPYYSHFLYRSDDYRN